MTQWLFCQFAINKLKGTNLGDSLLHQQAVPSYYVVFCQKVGASSKNVSLESSRKVSRQPSRLTSPTCAYTQKISQCRRKYFIILSKFCSVVKFINWNKYIFKCVKLAGNSIVCIKQIKHIHKFPITKLGWLSMSALKYIYIFWYIDMCLDETRWPRKSVQFHTHFYILVFFPHLHSAIKQRNLDLSLGSPSKS